MTIENCFSYFDTKFSGTPGTPPTNFCGFQVWLYEDVAAPEWVILGINLPLYTSDAPDPPTGGGVTVPLAASFLMLMNRSR